jgi:hypothetical protein
VRVANAHGGAMVWIARLSLTYIAVGGWQHMLDVPVRTSVMTGAMLRLYPAVLRSDAAPDSRLGRWLLVEPASQDRPDKSTDRGPSDYSAVS